MKILVIGDNHFKFNNINDTDRMVSKILSVAEESRPDLIVNLGDTLDRHESAHYLPLKRAINFIDSLRQIAPTVVIIGNHDRPNNSTFLTDDHHFNALKKWDSVYIVDVPTVLNFMDKKLLFVPYVFPGRLQEALDTLPGCMEPYPDMVFSHQEYYGAKMGAIVSDTGDKWPSEYPFNISGHVHDYDFLQDNLLYLGTPIPHSHGDKSTKCIMLVNLDREIQLEKIIMDVVQKVTIKVDKDTLDKEKIKELLDSGADVKLDISGTTEELSELKKDLDLKDLKIKVKYTDNTVVNDSVVRDNRDFLTKLKTEVLDKADILKIFKELFPGI